MPAIRILIVEDSAIQAELLRRLLVREGYEVFVARDGSEGLDMAQKHLPTLVISDINMPVMNGQEMCARIKDDERLRDIPVMLLTQIVEPEEVLRGLESGADAYVTKPYDEEFLLARVHLILEMPDSFKNIPDRKCVEFEYHKKHYVVRSGRSRTLSFLLSTYENALWHSLKLLKTQEELKKFNELLEEKVKGKTAELEAELVQKKKAEKIILKHNSELLSLVYLSNELMGVSLTADIYKTICELAVGNFGLRMAWLGLIEEGSSSLRIASYSGIEDGYLSTVRITWDDTPEGLGPTGRAIKAKTPSVINSIDANPLYAPWRDEALKRGYHSSIALPLISTEGRVFGALNLYSGEQLFFTERLIYILELFANQASLAIERATLIKRLEEKVEEITKADAKLRERVEELESFRKVTIKRELTMEKLRERVVELEEKLKGKL